MGGTISGGIKCAATNKKKYGDDFYKRLGQMGGHKSHKGGFAANPELAKIAGSLGGQRSKRGLAKKNKETDEAKDKRIKKNYKQMIKDFKAVRRASRHENKSTS